MSIDKTPSPNKPVISKTSIARCQGDALGDAPYTAERVSSPYEPPIVDDVLTHFSKQLMACDSVEAYGTLILSLSVLQGRIDAMRQWADFDLALLLERKAS